MPDTGYLTATVAVAAAITLALRAVPFAVLARVRDSATLDFLGRNLPVGTMVILVAYLLRDLPLERPTAALPDLLAVAATVTVHVWRRHVLLSITTGTLAHALLFTRLPRP